MGKVQVTAKQVRNGLFGNNIIRLGYCEAQSLFRGIEPKAYTCGVYGWNFDVYQVGEKVFCTGYRGMVGRKANTNVREYEQRAEEICNEFRFNWNEQQERLNKLREEFCEAV